MLVRNSSPVVRLVAIAVASLALRGDVVVPSTVYRGGLNQALFVSDVRVFNPTASPVNVTATFYDQTNGGAAVTKGPITIPARAQVAYDNVLQSLFGLGQGPFGPLRFETTAPIVVSSSVNNLNGCGNGSVSGQWLPGLDTKHALASGTLTHLAASADPKTGSRTNLDFMNPGDQTATVAVKIRKGDGSLLSSGTLSVAPNGLVQRAIDDGGAFPGVAGTTDTNLWAEFESDRPVLAFASVIANASGDPFAIVMTADPAVPPVAAFSFSPASPLPGEPVTFTDSSTHSPDTLLWSFGDGGTALSGSTVTHTYLTAGTYRAAHFAANGAGTSADVKEIVVGAATTPTPTPTPAPGTVPIAITAKQWTYEPKSVTLKAGTKYQITWTSADVLHGVGGLALLGIVSCNSIAAQSSCSATITPKSSQVGTYTYACTQSSCGAGHQTMTGTIVVTN